ncbi:MAG: transketolase C-terminal domain-containing protein [Thermodesulfobacteriota bacterium]
MKRVISGNQSVSHAVLGAKAQVIAAYPITPQSSIVEMLAGFCAEGKLQAKFINVESEHSAMAACISASVTGARTFTATSSQGLALMHELLHYASGLRLPIVMANVNRALGSPFNLKADLTDSLSQRDTGWLQFYCGSGQEVFDTIIQAYWISEKVLLPVMVNLEGFILSHTFEIVDLPEQGEIDRFLPSPMPRDCLDVENPCLFGGTTDFYINFRYKMHEEMERARALCRECDDHFEEAFGRRHGSIQTYGCEDADLILVTAGTLAGTCSVAADRYRERGVKVGVLRVRLFRPFPGEEIDNALRNAKKVAVIDRDFSPGCGGIFGQEIKSVLQGKRPLPVHEFIAGLGGKDVTDEDIGKIIDQTYGTSEPGGITWLGLLK